MPAQNSEFPLFSSFEYFFVVVITSLYKRKFSLDCAMGESLKCYRDELVQKENVASNLMLTSDRTLMFRLLSAWQMQPCIDRTRIQAFNNVVANEVECKMARKKTKKNSSAALKEQTDSVCNPSSESSNNEMGPHFQGMAISPTEDSPSTSTLTSSQKKKNRKKKKASNSLSVTEETIVSESESGTT